MRILIVAGLVAASLVPGVADAQTRHGHHDSHQRYEQRHHRAEQRHRWHAPFRYNRFRAGARIAPAYYGQSYWVNDWARYRVSRPARYERWVRHYDDLLLVDTRRGIVIRAYPGHFRGRW